MKERPPLEAPQRFHELDSLRGAAACTVVLCHFWAGLGASAYLAIWHSPLRFLVAGHDAVILFFILSGFVLALPYKRDGKVAYGKFIVKRICRIYLPYLGALMLAIALNYRYHGLITSDQWINSTWNREPNAHVIIQHIVFIGNYQWATFNTAFWSLVYEMRISLIFPFLALAVLWIRNEWMFGFALFTSLLSSHNHRIFLLLHLNQPGPQTANTLHYLSFFILGAIVAKNREFIGARFRKLSLLFVLLLVAFAITFYCHPYDVPVLTAAILPAPKIVDWSVAFGSLLVITLALYSGPFKNFLNHGAINYLGKISYSMYLMHGAVLFTMLYILRGRLLLAYLPIYLIAVLGLASIFYYLVEMPSMALGHKLGKMLH
ncbi:MAG: acyltransferase family protein [Terriglobia bacterium]